ncbi:MAG: hypothetical protein KBC57_05120 [Neisseriaceae bacterium]|nr:hypothetical protein [Neisseriaceae bacterium]
MRLLSLLLSLGLFFLLVFAFSGTGEGFNLAALDPLTSLNNLAFGFAFGLGVPEWLSFIVSGLIIFGLPLALWFGLNRWLSRRRVGNT